MSDQDWQELAQRQLEEFTVTTAKYRAENRRLRDALAGISRWTNPETDTLEEVIAYAREALAGDVE